MVKSFTEVSFLYPNIRYTSDFLWSYDTQGNLYVATSRVLHNSERQEEENVSQRQEAVIWQG